MSVGHEGLRTKAARLAAAAARLKRTSGASAPISLAFLTDRRRIPDPEPIFRAMPRGAAVVYRDYDDPRRDAIAHRYASICKSRGVCFLVAGDVDLANACQADGVHLPARQFGNWQPAIGDRRSAPSPVAGRRLPVAGLFTAACHNAGELRRAYALGADLAFLSPVFATISHPDTEHLGPARFKEIAAASPLPVLALGGVDETNARVLAGKNVAGFGAIGAFQHAGESGVR